MDRQTYGSGRSNQIREYNPQYMFESSRNPIQGYTSNQPQPQPQSYIVGGRPNLTASQKPMTVTNKSYTQTKVDPYIKFEDEQQQPQKSERTSGLVNNVILQSLAFAEHRFLCFLYLLSGITVLILAQAARVKCHTLIVWADVFGSFLIVAAALRLAVSIWTIIQGTQVEETFFNRAKSIYKWISIIEIFIFLILLIGFTCSIVKEDNHLECKSLYRVSILYCIASWGIIIFNISKHAYRMYKLYQQ